MTKNEFLKKYKGETTPWGPKLTPSAYLKFSEELQKLLDEIYDEGYREGYKNGKSDEFIECVERGEGEFL